MALTLRFDGAVTVTGVPTLTLNNGGIADYVDGSGTNALTFDYTVAAGQDTPDLAVSAVNLNMATVTDQPQPRRSWRSSDEPAWQHWILHPVQYPHSTQRITRRSPSWPKPTPGP